MVRMLNEDFPGHLPKDTEQTSSTKPAPKSVTAYIGSPYCGKTTLREVIKSASKFIGGHVSSDSSDIIDWHKEPINNSPYYEQVMPAEETRKSGGLINDELMFKMIYYWLSVEETRLLHKEDLGINRFDISGFPRTKNQYDKMINTFSEVKIFAIMMEKEQANQNRLQRIKEGIVRDDDNPERFENRWFNYENYTLPFIKWGIENDVVIPIKFNRSLRGKALKITRHASYTELGKKSVQRQVLNEYCDAYWLTMKIDDPKKYKDHMHEQLKYAEKNLPAPQSHLAKNFFASMSRLTATV